MAIDTDLEDGCPGCGKPIAEWTENDGAGVVSGGVTYCSDGCAIKESAGSYARDPDQ